MTYYFSTQFNISWLKNIYIIYTIICLDDKYEAVTVDSGYKIYMKLHIRNVTKHDFMEYR